MKSKDEILKKIEEISLRSNKGADNLNFIAPLYAELLCLLRAEAEEQSRKNLEFANINLEIAKTNLKLQKWMIGFTVLALVLAFIAALPVINHPFGSGNLNHQTNAPNKK